jgi:hypothetical protein
MNDQVLNFRGSYRVFLLFKGALCNLYHTIRLNSHRVTFAQNKLLLTPTEKHATSNDMREHTAIENEL